jgi:hypothetical protein
MTKPRVPGVPNRRYQRRTHSRPSPRRSLPLSLLLRFLGFLVLIYTHKQREWPSATQLHGGHTTSLLQTSRWPHSGYLPPRWVPPHATAPPCSHLGWNSIITHLNHDITAGVRVGCARVRQRAAQVLAVSLGRTAPTPPSPVGGGRPGEDSAATTTTRRGARRGGGRGVGPAGRSTLAQHTGAAHQRSTLLAAQRTGAAHQRSTLLAAQRTGAAH